MSFLGSLPGTTKTPTLLSVKVAPHPPRNSTIFTPTTSQPISELKMEKPKYLAMMKLSTIRKAMK